MSLKYVVWYTLHNIITETITINYFFTSINSMFKFYHTLWKLNYFNTVYSASDIIFLRLNFVYHISNITSHVLYTIPIYMPYIISNIYYIIYLFLIHYLYIYVIYYILYILHTISTYMSYIISYILHTISTYMSYIISYIFYASYHLSDICYVILYYALYYIIYCIL